MHAPTADHSSSRPHVHGRDWRPCPALYPPPLTPTKAISIWLYRWAAALLHDDTFTAFVAAYPAEFPTIAAARPPR